MVRESWSKAFELAWWPLDIAVSWVLTRDRTFVERQWRRSGNGFVGIEVSVAADQYSGRRVALKFENVSKAWTALKRRLETGEIKAVGTPFQRIADLSGNASETSEPQREIPDFEIESLMVERDGDDYCLIPEDWRVARGSNFNNLRGYRNVKVRTNGVIHYFPQEQNVELPSELLGPPATPHSPGQMSLSQAAYWVASKGGTDPFDLRNQPRWVAAFADLVPRISAGNIAVMGRKHGRGLAVRINSVSFSGVSVDYPYSETPSDLFFGERPHVRCSGIVDAEEWQKGLSDALIGDNSVPEYSHLQVLNSDLAREFPFSTGTSSAPKTSAKTGKPGRKPTYDWYEVGLFVQQALDRRGDFDDPDQIDDWKSQADLERSVAEHLSKQAMSPATSLIRQKIRPMIDTWRAQKGLRLK